MFAPILPRPTIPSCIDRSPSDSSVLASMGSLSPCRHTRPLGKSHFHTTGKIKPLATRPLTPARTRDTPALV
jgi:hypothetical protein